MRVSLHLDFKACLDRHQVTVDLPARYERHRPRALCCNGHPWNGGPAATGASLAGL